VLPVWPTSRLTGVGGHTAWRACRLSCVEFDFTIEQSRADLCAGLPSSKTAMSLLLS
jgi:hypothetical protein